MFDSLKDKLGRFQSDVEDAADERAEEGAEEEPPDEADPEAAPGSDGEAAGASAREADAADAGTAGPGSGDSAGAEADAGDREDAGADAGSEADEGGRDRLLGSESDADPDEEPESEGGGTGLGRKLKSAARGRVVIEEDDLLKPLDDLQIALLESNVEFDVAEEIIDGVEERLVGETRKITESTGSVVEDALREALLEVISVGQFDFDDRVAGTDRPVVIVFTGVNGVGKTTTIAKMARYFEERGLSTVLANGDTYRAGANEQIAEHADNLGEKLISHEQGGDPAAVVYDAVEYAEANDVDVVLGDTAGRLHTDNDLMAQLEKIHRVVDPDMTLFVDEAVAGQDAVRRAQEFNDAAEVDGAVLTKADADAQGGAAISIAYVTGKPILFLGTGQGYDDLERFDPEWLVDQLLGEE